MARAGSSLSAAVKSSLPRKSTRTFLKSSGQTAVRGDGGNAEACALLDRNAFWQRHRLTGRHDRVFGTRF